MNGIFWNSRGLRDLAKPLFLHDTSLEQNLDFICLLETVRNEFNNDELNHFCGNKNYLWTWNKPRGRLGCILVGVNMEVFHIANMIYGDFHVKLKLKNKDGFQWILVAVYGAAQQEYKEAFLTELAHTCRVEVLTILVGGDFNIIRNPREKNNDRFDSAWPFHFNVVVIDTLDLTELDLVGRKDTWANNLEIPSRNWIES
jgi:exonuclease III